jgi:hypothetical protein
VTRAEFEVDFGARIVRGSIRREFDVTPILLTIPFATVKLLAGGILAAEAEAEKAAANGGQPRLVGSPS